MGHIYTEVKSSNVYNSLNGTDHIRWRSRIP